MMSGGFEQFLALRGQLGDILSRLAELCAAAGAEERGQYLLAARSALEHDAFRLMIVGEFKRGKSTVINAMLGQSILPAKVAPCTAVITELKYGSPHALLHYVDQRPPLAVPVEAIRDYIQIHEVDDTPVPSPYSRLVVHYPLPLLKNNVEIVDSPGLNESQSRTDVALGYLPKADAVIMVLSCDQQLSLSELEFIDNHLGGPSSGPLRHVFFVWNRYDHILHSPEDRADLERRSLRYLQPKMATDGRIFYLSARDALTGRKQKSPELLDRSGMLAFEQSLETFLSTERGQVKLLTPLRAAAHSLHEVLNQHIPRQCAMLAQPIAQLQARYDAQKPELEALKQQREALLRTVDRRQQALAQDASAAYQNLVVQLCAELPAVTAAIEVGLLQTVFSSRSTQQKILKHLQDWLEKRILLWQQDHLLPLVQRHMEALQQDLNEKLGKFLRDLDAIRQAISPDVRVDGEENGDSPLHRVLNAVGGISADVGASGLGSGMNYQKLLRDLGFQLAIGAGLLVAGVSLPLVAGVLVAVGAFRALWKGSAAIDQIRTKVAEETATALRSHVPEVSRALEQQVQQQLRGVRSALFDGMGLLIREVEGSIEVILAQKRSHEAILQARQQVLNDLSAQFLQVADQLQSLRKAAGLEA